MTKQRNKNKIHGRAGDLPVLVSFILFLAMFSSLGWGSDPPRSKEDLLFEEIPIVITASHKEELLTHAPATVTVISSDDIKYSGATTIPDLLRGVAGVDVITISARDQQVGIRGFTGPVNNKVLVLLDGRTVFEEFYGSIFWSLFPVGLNEIDRIEVVKSPISSIYGGGAFSGVINIITKTPEQLDGTALSLTVGEGHRLITSIIHGGTGAAERFHYKISAEADKTDEWNANPSTNGGDIYRANGLAEYLLGDGKKVSIAAGTAYTDNSRYLSGEFFGTVFLKSLSSYIKADARFKGFGFYFYYKDTDSRNSWPDANDSQDWRIRLLDTEVIYNTKIGKHKLLFGVNWRYRNINESPLYSGGFRQHRWSGFMEGQIELAENLRITSGMRYDWHPLVGGHISPRFHLFYAPTENHIFRFSLSKAYLKPAFTMSYADINSTYYYNITPPFPRIPIQYSFSILGNREMEPERITSYELGIDSRWSDVVAWSLNIFYNRYSGFTRATYETETYDAGELFAGSPGGIFLEGVTWSFENGGDAYGYGLEIEMRLTFNKRFSGFANASYLQIVDREDNPFTPDIDEKENIRDNYPRLKINGGFRMVLSGGFSFDVRAHWVDRVRHWVAGNGWLGLTVPLKSYFLVDGHVGLAFLKKKAEVALSVFNLFDCKHFEYPSLDSLPQPRSFMLGRRIGVTLKYKF